MTIQSKLLNLRKPVAVIFFFLVLLISVTAWWIYRANSIKETPTCVSFKASGSIDAREKVLAGIQGVIDTTGMRLKGRSGESIEWESTQVEVNYYTSHAAGDYIVYVCLKTSDSSSWQDVTKKIERVLQGNTSSVESWLQKNNRDFKCDPNCGVQVPIPINFEQLNRIILTKNLSPG